MKFEKMHPMFLSDGIWYGNEYDPEDRSQSIYIGLDDNGYELKKSLVKSKMAHPHAVFGTDATMNLLYDKLYMFRVLDDDGNVVGYYLINSNEINAYHEDVPVINKAFAYCDEVEGLDDEEKQMFLMNRIINAEATGKLSEMTIPFEEVKVASCSIFPKSACDVANDEFNRKLVAQWKGQE